MATIEECRTALEKLSENIGRAQGDAADAIRLDRSVSCRITDLDLTFTGRLAGGRIREVATVPGPPSGRAQIRLAMTGDDLVALVEGRLHFAKAWAAGRVRLEVGLRDLLRLRSLL